MEYLWAASVTAMLARTWIWQIVMYLFLLYGCCRLPFSAFSKIRPWIVIALGICIAARFVPQALGVERLVVWIQSLLYFWIWYQCLRGFRELEGTYGNLNERAIRSACWTELVLAVLLVCGLSIAPWFDKMIPSALILLQTWKAYLLYGCHRNYEIRRKQLAGLTDCA